MTFETACEVCGRRQKVEAYSDWTCEQCGQKYKYEEGHQIVLTDEQLAALRKLHEKVG